MKRNRIHALTRYLMALALGVGLSACGSSAKTSYYLLDPVVGKPVTTTATVAIRQLNVARYLDRSNIVSRGDDNQLQLSEYHLWGGQLRENLERALGDNLAQRLNSASVVTAPFNSNIEPAVTLFVDVRQFERMPDGHLHLHVFWQLVRQGMEHVEYLDHFVGERQVEVSDYAAMTAGMSRLWGILADRMAEAIVVSRTGFGGDDAG